MAVGRPRPIVFPPAAVVLIEAAEALRSSAESPVPPAESPTPSDELAALTQELADAVARFHREWEQIAKALGVDLTEGQTEAPSHRRA